MWKTTIKTWSWVNIEEKTELKQCQLHFEFDGFEEATEFIQTVKKHSDVVEFELKYIKKGE